MIYLSTAQLSRRWGVSEATLIRWRGEGKGPGYHKIGDSVRYKLDTIEAYEKNREVARDEVDS